MKSILAVLLLCAAPAHAAVIDFTADMQPPTSGLATGRFVFDESHVVHYAAGTVVHTYGGTDTRLAADTLFVPLDAISESVLSFDGFTAATLSPLYYGSELPPIYGLALTGDLADPVAIGFDFSEASGSFVLYPYGGSDNLLHLAAYARFFDFTTGAEYAGPYTLTAGVTAISEPGTFALLIAGAAALWFPSRRKTTP
jgi:hypothetical protein